MAKKGPHGIEAPPEDGQFKTQEQVDAATADMSGAHTRADVEEVWRRHLMRVGHKVLGRLLLGLDPVGKKK